MIGKIPYNSWHKRDAGTNGFLILKSLMNEIEYTLSYRKQIVSILMSQYYDRQDAYK
jgi:hypothetical protein